MENDFVIHNELKKKCSSEMLKELSSKYPKQLLSLDRSMHLPIHRAIEDQRYLGDIETLASLCPDSLHVRNQEGATPLEQLICNQSISLDMRRSLMNVFCRISGTTCLQTKDEFGGIFFHRICRLAVHSSTLTLVKELALSHSNLLLFRDNADKTPLFNAVLGTLPLEMTELYLELSPTLVELYAVATLGSTEKFFPLHEVLAATNMSPLTRRQLTTRLASVYPAAALSGRYGLAIIDAIVQNHFECAEVLVDSGYPQGCTLLMPSLLSADGGFEANEAQSIVLGLLNRQAPESLIVAILQKSPAQLSLGANSERIIFSAIRGKYGENLMCELVEYKSQMCQNVERFTNNTPLHIALESGSPAAILSLLLNCNRAAAEARNSAKDYPLHCALRVNSAKDIIERLIDLNPVACKSSNNNGELPIHLALRSRCGLEIIRKLVATGPDSSKSRELVTANLPLHLAAMHGGGGYESVVNLLLASYAEGARLKNALERTPLHEALLASGTSLKVIAMIIELFPSAVAVKDQNGSTPFDIVFHTPGSSYSLSDQIEIIHTLFCAYDELARIPDKQGRYPFIEVMQCEKFAQLGLIDRIIENKPLVAKFSYGPDTPRALHAALQFRLKASTLELILKTFPDAAKERDSMKDYPLHIALRCSVPQEIILQILELHPEACQAKDRQGDLPIHFAVRSTQLVQVASHLLDIYPDGLQKRDKEKNMPLHYALESALPEPVVVRIITTFPEAVKQPNCRGDLPLHIGIRNKVSVGILMALIEVFPAAAAVKDKERQRPFDILMSFGDRSRYAIEEESELLFAMFQTNYEFAESHDERGVCPYHMIVGLRKYDRCELVPKVLENKPQIAQIRSKDGDVALHWAIRGSAPSRILFALLESFPDAARVRDSSNDLPLHYSIRHLAPDSFIAKLIETFPDGCKVQDKDGNLPLHYALRRQRSDFVISSLLKAYPEAVRVRDKEQNLPLHCALEFQASKEIVTALLVAYPDATKKANRLGDLPLHDAITKQSSSQIISAIIDVSREAVTSKDKEGLTPMDIVLVRSSSYSGRRDERSEIIFTLFQSNDKVASMQNAQGLCPIHVIASDRSFDDQDLVVRVVTNKPAVAVVRSKDGDLPLHTALQFAAPKRIIFALIEANPSGVQSKDRSGDLPIHFALQKSSKEVVFRLLDVYPEGCQVQDREGELPLHYALRSSCSDEIVQRLLDLNPNSVQIRDRQRNLPLHFAIENNASTGIIHQLLAKYPEGARKPNRAGDLALHDAIRRRVPFEIVESLVDVYKDAIAVKDEAKQTPMTLALQDFASIEVVAKTVVLFFSALPSISSQLDANGRGPLHVIASTRRYDNANLVQRVLERCPVAASAKSSEGDLALHFALQSRAPDSIILALLTAFPEGARVKDRTRDLPLHYALRENASSNVLEQLLEVYPDGCQVADREGNYPVHYALSNSNIRPATIETLIRRHPTAASRRNEQGQYPLHVAVEKNCPLSVIRLLCDSFPDALAAHCNRSCCPFPMMCAKSSYQLLCAELLLKRPNLGGAKSYDGQNGLHKLLTTPNTSFDVDTPANKLLLQYLEIGAIHLHSRDCSGNGPLSLFVMMAGCPSGGHGEFQINVLKLCLQATPSLVQSGYGPLSTTTLLLSATNVESPNPNVIAELLSWGSSLIRPGTEGFSSIYLLGVTKPNFVRVVSTIRYEGWLSKRGGPLGIYRRRWFRILMLGAAVVYFVDRPDKNIRGNFGLRQSQVKARPDLGKTHFEINCGLNSRTYILQADTEQELAVWMQHVVAATAP